MSTEGARDQTPKHRRFTDATKSCESLIGPDVSIKGDIRGTTDMEFCGTLEGSLGLNGFLWVRPGARIEGNLSATDLLVEGEVLGEIKAEGKVELRSSCHVEGNISARGIAIAEGGFFEGGITMAGKPSSRDDVVFEEKRSAEE